MFLFCGGCLTQLIHLVLGVFNKVFWQTLPCDFDIGWKSRESGVLDRNPSLRADRTVAFNLVSLILLQRPALAV
jgi:hypothetical protein